MTEEIKPPVNEPDFKFTAKFIVANLELFHAPDEWAFWPELRVGTGYGKDSQQSFDAYAIHYLKGKRNTTRCYEIKVSRSDFFSEIKKPLKRRAGMRLSNEFYFVCPKAMVKIEEVPIGCGLMEMDEKGTLSVTVEAPYREASPTWQFVAAIGRRLDIARRMEYEIEEKVKKLVLEREALTRTALERHLKKWEEHKVGSREIPDRIVDAMRDLQMDVNESIELNRNCK